MSSAFTRWTKVAVLVLVAGIGIGLGVYAWAAPSWDVPQTLHYQGRLLDAAGHPVTGTVPMTFRIWNDATSIAPADLLWVETISADLDESGFFEVTLGATAGHELPSDLFEGEPRWLGIEPRSSGELSPRQAIQSVPYALRAGVASGLAEGAEIRADTLTLAGTDIAAELADLRSRVATLEAGIPWTSITGVPTWPLPSGTVVRMMTFRWVDDPVTLGPTDTTWAQIGQRAQGTLGEQFVGWPFPDGLPGTSRQYRLRIHYTNTTTCSAYAAAMRIINYTSGTPCASTTVMFTARGADSDYRSARTSEPLGGSLSCPPHQVLQARIPIDLFPPGCTPGTTIIYAVDLIAEDVVP